MSKIQWEYDLVERPFCQQLKGMGWQWIEGDKDVPEFTERQNFGEVLLKGRLAAAPSMMSGLALSESSQPRDRARRGEQRAIRLDAAAPGERSRFPPRLRLREAPDAPLESQDAKPVEMRSPGDLIAVTTPVNSMSASTACAGFMPSVSFTRSEWRVMSDAMAMQNGSKVECSFGVLRLFQHGRASPASGFRWPRLTLWSRQSAGWWCR